MHMTKKKRLKRPAKPPVWRPTFLRNWREFADATLEEMGEILGMDYSTLSKIERGQSPYSQKILEAYAARCRCTVTDLLSRRPDEAKGIESIWPRLDETQKRRAIRLLDALADEE